MTNWLVNHWINMIIPILIFLGILILGLSVRIVVYNLIKQKQHKTGWLHKFVVPIIWQPFIHWTILLGIYAAIQISILSQAVKRLVGNGVASLFVLSLMWVAVKVSETIVISYLGKSEVRHSVITTILNVVRIGIAVIGILTIFYIWGAPVEPIIFFIAAIIFVVGLALRNNLSNVIAWLDIVYGENIKVGHFIKLESGEAGYVTQISLTKTIIRATEGNLVIIPNNKIITSTIINYGIPEINNNEIPKHKDTVESIKLVDILTEREREILKLIGHGASNREIAQKLFISEHTVKSHIRSILNKLNIRNRQQAAVYAERQGLVTEKDALETIS